MAYEFDWSVLYKYRAIIWDGLLLTLLVSSLNLVFSFIIGSVIGTARHFLKWPGRLPFIAYVEFFRNIPPIVQLFFWYFAVGLDSLFAAVIGLSIYSGAYIAEVVRSGYNSIAPAQIDAARSSGMTFFQMARHVVYPLAIVQMIPALTIEFINIITNSSLAMTLGVVELTFQVQQIESDTFRGFEAASAVTVIYAAMSISFALLIRAVETRFKKRR